MKKILLLLVFTVSANAFAQSVSADDVAIIQGMYGKSKAEVVKQYMALSEPQAAAFQAIYDNYEIERKALGQAKIKIIEDYAKNYSGLTDEKAAELTEANLKNNKDFEKLLCKTYKKTKKAIGGLNAAKFVQLEQYLQVNVRIVIQESIPFIDELDKSRIK